MKFFLITLILIFNFQSLSKADDIKDFEIEGMSIGDNLLNYIDVSKIDELKESYYKDNLYSTITIFPGDTKIELKNYDALVISFLSKDNEYILQAVSGIIIYKEDILDCNKKRILIVEEFNSIFSNIKPQINNFDAEFGKIESTEFDYKNQDKAIVACYNYDPHPSYTDHLRVSLNRGDFLNWIENKAYK